MLLNHFSKKLAVGAIAGFVATAPMSLVMALMHSRLPWWQRYAVPPKQIVGDLAEVVGLKHRLDRTTKNTVTAVAHFAYGACMGVPFAVLEDRFPGRLVTKGACYGCFVWIANYLVGLPAADFSASATKEPVRRSAMMVVAHLVWGATLGAIVEAILEGIRIHSAGRVPNAAASRVKSRRDDS